MVGNLLARLFFDAYHSLFTAQGFGFAPVLTRSLRFTAGCGLRAGPCALPWSRLNGAETAPASIF